MREKARSVTELVRLHSSAVEEVQQTFCRNEINFLKERKSFIAQLEQLSDRHPFHKQALLNLRIVNIGSGFISTEFIVGEEHLNYLSTLHGGAFDSIVDTTMWMAALTHINSAQYAGFRKEQHIINLAPALKGECLEITAETNLREAQLTPEGVAISPIIVEAEVQRKIDHKVLARAHGSYAILPHSAVQTIIKNHQQPIAGIVEKESPTRLQSDGQVVLTEDISIAVPHLASGHEMGIKKGMETYIREVEEWLEEVLAGTGWTIDYVNTHYISLRLRGFDGLVYSFSNHVSHHIKISASDIGPIYRFDKDIDIHVPSQEHLDAAKKIAQAYEKKTGKKATLYSEY